MGREMIPNRRLILPYAAPYFVYIFIASVFKNHISVENSYIARLIVVSLLLLWARKWYFSIKGPKSVYGSIATGSIAGVLGFFIWVLFLTPFVGTKNSSALSHGAFLLKFISVGILVPVFEELFMRGFIFRIAYQWDITRKTADGEPLQITLDTQSVNDVVPGTWSWPAVFLSTIAFVLGHYPQEWLAATAYGLLMVYLWIIRKDLLSCIVAHAVTNISLALFVVTTGRWNFW
jgi:CAAX protease family protein